MADINVNFHDKNSADAAYAPRDTHSITPGNYNLSEFSALNVDARGRVRNATRALPGQDVAWTTGSTLPTVSAALATATVVMYVPANPGAYTRLVGSSVDGGLVLFPTTDNRLQAYVQGGAYLTQSNAVIDWTQAHIVAFSYDTTTGFLMTYIDGKPIGTDRRSGGFSFTATSATLNTVGVSEIRRWTRVLHGRELRQVMRQMAFKYSIVPAPLITSSTPAPLLHSGIKGFNLHPKTAQFTGGLGVWEQVWGAQWDWSWVQSSIDLAATRNSNVFRVIGDVQGIKAGTITQSVYTARLTQIADYIASKGMRLYYCGADFSQRGSATQADIVAQFTEAAKVLQAHIKNVLGFDLANEIRTTYSTTPKATIFPWLQAASAAIRSVAPLVPLSVSDIGGGGSDDGGSAGGVVSRASCYAEYVAWAPYVDFFDVHAYEDVVGEFRSWQLGGYAIAIDRPLVIGEFGVDYSQTNGDTIGAAFIGRVAALANGTHGVACVVSWAIRANGYGMYRETDSALRSASAAAFDSMEDGLYPIATTAATTVSDATSSVKGVVQLAGDLTGTAAAPTLASVITAGSIGSSSAVPVITYDAKGRITAVSSAAISSGGSTAGALNVVNVKDAAYGAKGDNSTDDKTAIQNAINAVASRGNNNSGIVYFPPGTYLTSAKITVPANIKLVGEGAGTSILLFTGSTDTAGYFITFGTSGTINTNGGVERMQIDANLKLGWALLMYGPQEGSCIWMSLIRGGTTGGLDCRSSGISGGNNKFLIASSWIWANGSTAMYGAKFDDANGPFAIRDTTFVRTGGGTAPAGSAGIYFSGGYQHVANVNCEQWESHTSIDAWSNYRADTLSSYGCTYGITRRAYSGADSSVRVVVENLTFDSATAYIRDLQQSITITSCKRWSNREIDSSAWNGSHLTLGSQHIWVDSSALLRTKAGAPASDADGFLIGLGRLVGTNSQRTALATGAIAEGTMFYCTDTKIEYLYTGGAWKAWSSQFTSFTPGFDMGSGGNSTSSTISGRWRYRAGQVVAQMFFQFGASSVMGSYIRFGIPIGSFDNSAFSSPLISYVQMRNQSDSNRWYTGSLYVDSSTSIRVVSVTGATANPGISSDLSGGVPFNEAWASGDQIIVSIEYDYV